MNDSDKHKIQNFYDKRKMISPMGSHSALSWASIASQEARFKVLSEIADLNFASVLDVGCGFGDLYTYLSQTYTLESYTGIDLDNDFINFAKENIKADNAKFMVGDFTEIELPPTEYIFACGSLNNRVEGGKEFYLNILAKLFKISEKALGFNMLDEAHHISDEEFLTYKPSEVLDFCLSLSSKVVLRHDYLEHDFTVFVYK